MLLIIDPCGLAEPLDRSVDVQVASLESSLEIVNRLSKLLAIRDVSRVILEMLVGLVHCVDVAIGQSWVVLEFPQPPGKILYVAVFLEPSESLVHVGRFVTDLLGNVPWSCASLAKRFEDRFVCVV